MIEGLEHMYTFLGLPAGPDGSTMSNPEHFAAAIESLLVPFRKCVRDADQPFIAKKMQEWHLDNAKRDLKRIAEYASLGVEHIEELLKDSAS